MSFLSLIVVAAVGVRPAWEARAGVGRTNGQRKEAG